MSKELVISQESNVLAPVAKGFSMPSVQEMDHLVGFCKVMAQAPFYQKLGPGGVMAIYLTAKEFNLPFMACLNGGMHTFDGKVTFSAGLINAMIVNAGHKVDVIHLDDTKCVIRFWRCDRKDSGYQGFTYEYNVKMAEKAGYLNKQNWKTSLRDMLFARCLTGGGRKHTPEVFVGVLVAGELVGDNSDANVTPSPAPIPTNATAEALESTFEKAAEDEMTQEALDEFYKTFNGNEEMTRQYIQMCMKKRKWTESEAVRNAQKSTSARAAYDKWVKAQVPVIKVSVPGDHKLDTIEMGTSGKNTQPDLILTNIGMGTGSWSEAPSMEPKSVFEQDGK